MVTFEHDYAAFPELMQGGIRRYVEDHIQPGSFLSAVLCNDLRTAVIRADETNLKLLPLYVAYFDRFYPSLYGKENFAAHIAKRNDTN